MNDIKVLLVKPYNVSDHIQPSLGLGYLASAARKNHIVSILDCIKENIHTRELFYNYIKKNNPNVVGVQVYTQDMPNIRSVLETIKDVSTDIVTVIGGPHPSALPRETFERCEPLLDYLFHGEAEIGFPLLLDELSHIDYHNCRDLSKVDTGKLLHIPGLVWKSDGKIVINRSILIHEIDSLGFPSWDIIKPNEYPEAQHGAFFKKFPIAPIITSRGCPFSCTFCAAHIVSGRKLRRRSIDSVIAEIKYLCDNHGIREIHVIDDNFTGNKEYVLKFCRELIKEELDISWATPNGIRIDTLDGEILTAMKESGYYLASIGIESGVNRILKLMKKNLTSEEVKRRIKMIRKLGLDVAGFFIIGYPGETRREIKRTIRYSLRLGLIRANFFSFLPLPGTKVYYSMLKEGTLQEVDWEKFYFTNPVYAYNKMRKSTLRHLQKLAFIRFYMRPYIIYKNIIQIKSLRHLEFLFKRAWRWVIK